ncbi:MAG: hypothetical protein EYC68_13285 [Chloroflexota bacterium]|nr:MAG: hypothetical protein EYC68_13285 [Chloroflexota bacterium]
MFDKYVFKIARGGMFLLALLVVFGAFSVAPTFAQEGTEGVDGTEAMPPTGQKIKWSDFTGAPTIPASTLGLWIWSEDVGGQEILHIRTGSDGAAKTFAGAIETNGSANFYDAAVVNGTGDDTVSTPKYNRVEFSLATTGGGEGIDVNWSGNWLFLDLKINGAYVPSKIFTGAAAKQTSGAPLGVRAGTDGLLTLPITMLDGATPFVKNGPNGYYLYRTGKRYHLRLTTTSAQDAVKYRGRILAEQGKFRIVKEYKGENADYVLLTDYGKTLKYHFFTKGYVDGMDWVINGPNKPDNMIFTLKMDGQVAAPNIALGANPFGTVKALTFRLVE